MMPPLHPRFSEGEYTRRYQAVRQLLAGQQIDGLVVYGNREQGAMLHYLANFTPRWESFLLFPAQGQPVLFVQLFNHLPDARRISVVADTRWGGSDSAEQLALEIRERTLDAARLGLSGAVPYQKYAALRRALPDVEWCDLTGDLTRLRWIKSPEEIQRMRDAAALTDLAMKALAEGISPGMQEKDLPGVMQAALRSIGGQLELCYLASTSMSDPSVCVPAQNPSCRVLQSGDVVITEIGAGQGGYAGQIHRPLTVKASPSKEYRQLFDVAAEAYHRIVEVIRPGASEQDVLDAAEIIHEKGYTIYDDLVHGFGGGYLPPVLRTRQTVHGPVEPFEFQENMCIVVQPNVITRDERMGLQLGQLHRVTRDGLEPLQSYPLEFIVTS
ncbi:MAG TPA: M24 family metallopeptidase [Anaerolineales bacterium]|nr:M24 family metallopeptidase [Anaerolineales bacterium]